MGSDQPRQGHHGLDGPGGLDVTTAEVPEHAHRGTSVLADQSSRRVLEPAGPVSINLETSDVPFHQPNPRTLAVESPGHDWRAAIVDAGRWPILALVVTAVVVAVFAAFISRNSRSLGDGESTETPEALESASAAPSDADQMAASPARAEIEPDPLAANDELEGSSGRSTGRLGPAAGAGFFTGQIVEPDRSLTGPDVNWAPTTTRPPTTQTTVITSSTEPPTTTPDTTAVPDGIQVRAVAPGTADEANPAVVSGGRVTLEAEGSDDGMRYRFVLSVRDDDGDWRRVERSNWRSSADWTVKTKRFKGRTVRWTVIGIDRSRDLRVESAPLYFRVGGGDED